MIDFNEEFKDIDILVSKPIGVFISKHPSIEVIPPYEKYKIEAFPRNKDSYSELDKKFQEYVKELKDVLLNKFPGKDIKISDLEYIVSDKILT